MVLVKPLNCIIHFRNALQSWSTWPKSEISVHDMFLTESYDVILCTKFHLKMFCKNFRLYWHRHYWTRIRPLLSFNCAAFRILTNILHLSFSALHICTVFKFDSSWFLFNFLFLIYSSPVHQFYLFFNQRGSFSRPLSVTGGKQKTMQGTSIGTLEFCFFKHFIVQNSVWHSFLFCSSKKNLLNSVASHFCDRKDAPAENIATWCPKRLKYW